MRLTRPQARRFLLAHQGLLSPNPLKGKTAILDYIHRVGCIQYDPLDIVGKNPELVLQARVADFRPHMLSELLYEDRQLLDGFDKNMAIYHVEDWPCFRRRREAARRNSRRSAEAIRSVLPQIRAAFEEHGPLSSLDLDLNEKVDWDWSESRLARAALESMYFWGELVIHHKVHTRKVYDLTHRCLPERLLQAPDPNPTEEQYHDWYVLRRIGSVGLLWNRAGEAWLGSPVKSKERSSALERLLIQGRIGQVRVEGFQEPFYYRLQDKACLDRCLEEPRQAPSQASVMAPLDNLLWDRRLLKEMFAFDYRWEVYVPVDQRRYGYYVLPVLYGDRFIARFEPSRDRQNGLLTIKNWWWEPGVAPSETMQFDLAQCFRRFLRYAGLSRLEIDPQLQERAGLQWMSSLTPS